MDTPAKFDFGDLQAYPISTDWGGLRGGPVDRYYIDRFIEKNRHCISGRVLEVGGDEYANRYGGDAVTSVDIVDIDQSNSRATIIDNLETGRRLLDNYYDCIILTQVLVVVERPLRALKTCLRILKEGGTVLITVPGISQISHYKVEEDIWHWTFYPKNLRMRLKRAGFCNDDVEVESHGNLKTTISFLAGLGQADLAESDFDLNDRHYPLNVAAKAIKTKRSRTAFKKTATPGIASYQMNPYSTCDGEALDNEIALNALASGSIPEKVLDSSPLISIIMIFFNGEKFIHEAIQSVLSQSYSNYELVLIDDGSSDHSSEIAQGYAEMLPEKVRYYTHPGRLNRGMSASRNLGFKKSSGEYIAFIDCDDRWRPRKLQEQLDILKAHPTLGMVCGAVNYWKSWNGMEDQVIPTGHRHDSVLSHPESTLSIYPFGESASPCPSDILLRRSAYSTIGGFEEHFGQQYITMYEDIAFFSKLYIHSDIYCSSSVWLDYRLHDDSCVQKTINDGKQLLAKKHFLSWYKKYLGSQSSDLTKDLAGILPVLQSSESDFSGEGCK